MGKWVGSPNFWMGRRGYSPIAVVIHVTEGSLSSVDDWFSRRESQVSAHTCIGRKGEVHDYVKPEDSAWHAGRVKEPVAELAVEMAGVNPNYWTLGLEHEGSGTTDFTDKQYELSAAWIREQAKRFKFPINERTIIPHNAIFSGKSCPGPMDMPRLIELARGTNALDPAYGEQRWSNYFGSNITLVHWISDERWYFTVNKKPLHYGITRAQTRWSMMPKAV